MNIAKIWKKLIKFRLYVLIVLLILLIGAGYLLKTRSTQETSTANNQNNGFLKAILNPETNNSVDAPTDPTLPTTYLIENFPFQSQAPLGNWDALHEEACEEASIILVYYYLNNKTLTSTEMDQQILAMVALEEKDGKTQQNLSVENALSLAKQFYNLGGAVTKNATITDLKREISLGHPVLIPSAGRLLGNPNFKSPGPIYHMVVAIGYDQNNIIVQDVGTRNGEHYTYNQKIFDNAWHDWAGSPENIADGEKNLLILTNQE